MKSTVLPPDRETVIHERFTKDMARRQKKIKCGSTDPRHGLIVLADQSPAMLAVKQYIDAEIERLQGRITDLEDKVFE